MKLSKIASDYNKFELSESNNIRYFGLYIADSYLKHPDISDTRIAKFFDPKSHSDYKSQISKFLDKLPKQKKKHLDVWDMYPTLDQMKNVIDSDGSSHEKSSRWYVDNEASGFCKEFTTRTHFIIFTPPSLSSTDSPITESKAESRTTVALEKEPSPCESQKGDQASSGQTSATEDYIVDQENANANVNSGTVTDEDIHDMLGAKTFVFAGKSYKKGPLVKAIVKEYCSTQAPQTIEELKDAFPDSLRGDKTQGTVRDLATAEYINGNYSTLRYFFNNDDHIKLSNGDVVVVCNQWGGIKLITETLDHF